MSGQRCGRTVRCLGFLLLGLGGMTGSAGPLSAQVMDNMIYSFVLLDQLEYRSAGKASAFGHEMLGWIGGDLNRLWFKSEGRVPTRGRGADVEVQALYGRLIHPFWDIQIGARLDLESEEGETRTRGFAAIGLEGLAPYWFEVEPTVFVSQAGDISARLTSSYEVYLGQRLIAQPRVEVNAAVQEVPEFGVSSGVNDLDLGLRLRYEIRRELAPYIGVGWLRQFGGAAEQSRGAGLSASRSTVLLGLRAWF